MRRILLIIIFVFAAPILALAAPTIFFDPGTELMPSCAPGTCTVRSPFASSSAAGILSAADWSLFNAKQSALGYIPYDAANPSGYISSSSIGSSTDVAFSALASGNFLKYDGTFWINAGLSVGDIPNLDMSKVTTGSLHWERVTSTPTTLTGYGITDLVVNSFNGRSGSVLLISSDITGALGYVPYEESNPANYITRASLSASAPLQYSTTTGAFSLPQAGLVDDGYLSAADWNLFNGKLSPALGAGQIFVGSSSHVAVPTMLSGDASLSPSGTLTIAPGAVDSVKILDGSVTNTDLATSSFTVSVVATGTDAAFTAASASLGGTLALNLPNAGSEARGLVSTGTQSIAGDKTFLGNATLNGNLALRTTTAADDVLLLSPRAGGGLSFTGTLAWEDLTADRTWTLPNASGTLMLTSNTLPLNQLAAAVGTNAIDSLNFAQAWNWSTATTQSPLTLAATGLTSGDLLTLHSSGIAHTGSILTVNDASTGAFSNGGVRFNFTGAHAGNGLQIDDVTASGRALAINANSLTSGTGLQLTSSAAALTGDLAWIEASGSNAAVTGAALKVGITGPLAAGTALNLTNAGTGLSVRVNDDGTYTDSSPFVIDALGRVGIGTTTPVSPLHVIGKVTASGGFNGQCLSSGVFTTSLGNSCNMDVAESYDTFEPTEPGDVVVIPAAESQEAAPSSDIVKIGKSRGETGETLIGVVSTNPGLVFRNGSTYLAGQNDQFISPTSTVVALVGRVPVKVSLENGPIRAGDELAVADQTIGTAARAVRPGMVIGIALQSYGSQEGGSEKAAPQVLAFINPHWSLGNLTDRRDIASGPEAPAPFVDHVQHALRALGIALGEGIATIRELFTERVTTHELCLEEICVTKEELQRILESASVSAPPAQTPLLILPEAEIQPDISAEDENAEVTPEATVEELVVPSDNTAQETIQSDAEEEQSL